MTILPTVPSASSPASSTNSPATAAPPSFESKIISPTQLINTLANKLAAAPSTKFSASSLRRPLVFTNGCFDLLHRGHVTYLARAKALGATLLVAVNSDESVRALDKGKNRPINPLADRMALLAALQCVDVVTWFDEPTPLEVIVACRPDFLVKGGDWAPQNIVGAKEISQWGGQVVSIAFEHLRSTTGLIEAIRKSD